MPSKKAELSFAFPLFRCVFTPTPCFLCTLVRCFLCLFIKFHYLPMKRKVFDWFMISKLETCIKIRKLEKTDSRRWMGIRCVTH